MSLDQIRRLKEMVESPYRWDWLVVEDNLEDRYLLLDALKSFPIIPQFAGTLADAKAMAANKRFGLCLFDPGLPDVVNPVEAIDELKAVQNMPLAILTGGLVSDKLRDLIENRKIVVFNKPLTQDQLRFLV